MQYAYLKRAIPSWLAVALTISAVAVGTAQQVPQQQKQQKQLIGIPVAPL